MNAKKEPPNVYERLSEAREKFHATKLEKSGHNKFAGYKYFELGDFLIPALRILRECGLVTTPIHVADGCASMTLVNIDNPSDCIDFASPIGSANLKGCHEVQNVGAVKTYMRRYLWTDLLEIVEHDALDSSPPAETDTPEGRKEYPFPDGPAKGITELKNMVRPVWRDIKSCGDEDELEACIVAHKAVIEQASNLENPTHLRELWEGDGKDNPGLKGVIAQARADVAGPNILQAG